MAKRRSLICCQDGHLTVDRNNRAPPSVLKHFGKGLPRCGFCAILGGVDAVVAAHTVHNVVVVTVQFQEVTLQMIIDELHAWGMEGWDWQFQ